MESTVEHEPFVVRSGTVTFADATRLGNFVTLKVSPGELWPDADPSDRLRLFRRDAVASEPRAVGRLPISGDPTNGGQILVVDGLVAPDDDG